MEQPEEDRRLFGEGAKMEKRKRKKGEQVFKRYVLTERKRKEPLEVL